MSTTRRDFLTQAALGLGAAAGTTAIADTPTHPPANTPPGTPPAFGTGAGMGPAVSAHTFLEAEKLMQVTLTAAERAQAAHSWRASMSALYERRLSLIHI